MVRKVLTINQSNTTGNLGIQKDLADFQALNVFGFTVITAINTDNTHQLELIDDSTINNQLESIFATGHIDSIKLANIYSKSSIDIIKHFADKYSVKHLVYEIPYLDINKSVPQEIIQKLAPLVVLTEVPLRTTDEYQQQVDELFNKGLNYLALTNIDQTKPSLLYNNRENFLKINPTKQSLANYLTAELAIHQNLNHLLLKNN